MGSGSSAASKKKYAAAASRRAGLTDQEKDLLDAREEPLENKWQEVHWSCSACGIAMSDIWNQSMCHGCCKRLDPEYRPKHEFPPPIVVYSSKFKNGPDLHDAESKVKRRGSVSSMDGTDDGGASSYSRSQSKASTHNTGNQEKRRGSSKVSVKSSDGHDAHHERRQSSKATRSSSKMLLNADGSERLVVDNTSGVRNSSKQHSDEPQADQMPERRQSIVPPNISDAVPYGEMQDSTGRPVLMAPRQNSKEKFRGAVSGVMAAGRLGSKEPGHGERRHSTHGHHEHGEHHHHHHEHHGERRKSHVDTGESVTKLAECHDAHGQHLNLGDRVIGEGKIGLDMGPGTIVGGSESHGHSMVVVQYDDSGHSHPMKSEHIEKLDPRKQAELAKHKSMK